MKLVNLLTLRLSAIGALVFAFWATLFYFAIIDEINDEVDDSLEDHAETVIRRSLAGEPLPDEPATTNNQYYLHEVSAEYAASRSHIRYEDNEVYIKAKNEFEPARTISYIFNDDRGRFFEVVVFTPTIDKADLKAAVAYWLAALYAAMVACIVVVNRRSLRRGMRPLQAILAWLDDYRLGERNKEMPKNTSVTEFRRLGEAICRTTKRNEALFEEQKRFTANASHELQTPLAVIQSRLEMLLDDGQLTEQQMGEVVKALHRRAIHVDRSNKHGRNGGQAAARHGNDIRPQRHRGGKAHPRRPRAQHGRIARHDTRHKPAEKRLYPCKPRRTHRNQHHSDIHGHRQHRPGHATRRPADIRTILPHARQRLVDRPRPLHRASHLPPLRHRRRLPLRARDARVRD